MSKDINQVVTRDQQDALEAFALAMEEALIEVTGYSGNDPETMKAIMREKNIQIHKIINRDETGYHIMMGELHLKFIPAAMVDGVLI